ncbi:MAG: MBL fold metallo-hydrolase [Alphaproteobacteria bacterium]|nr:MBL fold metallo-hydrolase [Alphaproteobacteria bacterium]
MKINFWGVRGSYPCWGKHCTQIGGQTSCVSATLANARHSRIIFDMGTGMIDLGKELLDQGIKHITVIVSHFHLDHLMGLAFFKPIWDEGTTLTFYSPHLSKGLDLETILKTKLFCPPLFPIPFQEVPATCVFKTFQTGDSLNLSKDTTLKTLNLNHPGCATGYRLEHGNKAFCYITDHEHSAEFNEDQMLRFVQKADLMVFDTMFTPEDSKTYVTWGHSSWQSAVDVAQKAAVKRLALFHINPHYDDDKLLKIEKEAQALFPCSFLAREGSSIDL